MVSLRSTRFEYQQWGDDKLIPDEHIKRGARFLACFQAEQRKAAEEVKSIIKKGMDAPPLSGHDVTGPLLASTVPLFLSGYRDENGDRIRLQNAGSAGLEDSSPVILAIEPQFQPKPPADWKIPKEEFAGSLLASDKLRKVNKGRRFLSSKSWMYGRYPIAVLDVASPLLE
ncbi:MAG: hypothetical protein SGARI_002434 [Bacillariaceae sp.]